MTTEVQEQIRDDVRKIVGGHFTPDAYSPEVYDAVLARVRAQTADYLQEFEAMYLSDDFDAIAQSRLYLPSFLKIAAARQPERARADAARLLKRYTAVMLAYDDATNKDALLALLTEETVRTLQRLEIRRKELQQLQAP